ncbi:ABC transporter permease [Microbacterium sp. NC79]|uniref:ABC transporter permease n=1 Tax=Microbacterium sp. NC79 TaxID=2851009 RepID=UPI001C2C4965|nr:ABC transporter permease [Microbacterium sp. NC79]MBV0896124.1 ABC transporter permease [Microbacterium sp. NC79]
MSLQTRPRTMGVQTIGKVRIEPNRAMADVNKRARRDKVLQIALGFMIPVLGLILWEVAGQNNWIDVRFFSSPSAIFARFLDDMGENLIFPELWITVQRLLWGYVIGALAGIIIGLLMSQITVIRWALEPLIRALYVIPKLALLPIFLLLFGLGEFPKILFVALGTFYIVAFTTLAAAMMIPTPYHEVARSYGLSWPQRFRWLVIPASTPQIVSSLKLASGISMLLVIAVEFVQAREGLGYYTWHAWELFIPDRMYVGIVLISLLGVSFSLIVGAIGSRATRWADSEYNQSR